MMLLDTYPMRTRWINLAVGCAVLLVLAAPALAQRGQFDAAPVNPVDEAYIFTPPGFTQAGKVVAESVPNGARLNVRIVDDATGKPTLCRVNVVGSDGNFYQPKDSSLALFSLNGIWPETTAGNRPSKAPIRYFGHFFYTSGEFSVEVPPGATRIEVWKGFEHRPIVHLLDVKAGATETIALRLVHTVPMAKRDWYSGDPHLHFIRASDNDEQTIFDLLEAEDMRFGMVLAYNETNSYPGLMPELITPQLCGLGTRSIRSRGDYQILSGQEYRNVVFGHVLLLMRENLVLDGTRLDPNLGPVFGTLGAETRQQGGVSFHAHGGYGQEIWADLVQGTTDGVELLQFGIYRGIGLDGWYRALNCGFRFPGVGACDYPACRKLGDCRTYVQIKGEPTFNSWLQGAAAGRSFMTSGPLLLLSVDDKQPGDIIITDNSAPHKVTARIALQSEVAPVTDLQLIVNGQVIKHRKLEPQEASGHELLWEEELTLDKPSWIAARAFSKSPTGTADAEAHTNPIYVYLGGRRPYSPDDLDWLATKLDEQTADHSARKAPERSVPVEYFGRSRAILAAIKAQGGLVATDIPAELANKKPNGDALTADTAGKPVPTEQSASDAELAEFLKPVPATPPSEVLKTFEVQNGFKLELAAHEPEVTDPVAACFDEDGGMYVAEMIDYPYRPQDPPGPLGRVRYLQDIDGDGRYETSTIFADHIVWPTGVVCWKGGVYVAAAPDIWYCRDTSGDHVADVRQKIYTGFGDRNQQGGVNNLNWGIDHRIYGAGSTNGGKIQPADRQDAPPILLSDRDFRFDPRSHAFETITGSEQFGNAFDDWFNRFVCSESKPAYHVVLPQQFLARNPYLAVDSGIKDLAPGVTPIFRTSPIERWRQIRSGRRLAAGERKGTSAGASHNVIDAAAGLTIYRGHAYPPEYQGDLFIGCSQNNLVHRRKITPDGASFKSTRADVNTEFVRSTDTWFRPVNCINAPDGTIYILDMSREVIESIHIANDVVAHLDLTSGRDKGRIYRLAPPGFKSPAQPKLSQATSAELVETLEHPGGWWRDTASRLLWERQDRSVVARLRQRLAEAPSPVGRMHILWALDGLESLEDRDLIAALADRSPRVREHAVRLAAGRLHATSTLLEPLLALAADPDATVRFQVAFALGETTDPRAIAGLAAIATHDANDNWTRTAVLSSAAKTSGRLLRELTRSNTFLALPEASPWLEQLATIVGTRNDAGEIQQILELATELTPGLLQQTVVLGLGAGLGKNGQNLGNVKPMANSAAAGMLTELVDRAATKARDEGAEQGERLTAIRLLGYSGSKQTLGTLAGLVDPLQPEALQLAAIRTLSRESDPEVAVRLISVWRRSTPKVQDEIIAALASRPAWATLLLDACQREEVTAGQITGARRVSLINHSDPEVRARAERLLAAGTGPRADVVAQYQAALTLSGDAARGEKIYERECQACHRLAERGFAVGPNLALVRNRTPAGMLEAILDPSREVQPNYVNYVIVDDTGRTLTGLITSETANSITLAREKGAGETILKKNIEQMQSTGKSLMPEGLEKTIDVAGLADLLAFLKQTQYDIGTLPDFATPGKPQ